MIELTGPMVALGNQTEMDFGCSWAHSGELQKGYLPSGQMELQRGPQLMAACFQMLARQKDCCWTRRSDSLMRTACFQTPPWLREKCWIARQRDSQRALNQKDSSWEPRC